MSGRQTHVIILLNGEPYEGEIPERYVLCCDGAYRWAKGRVRIDENLGDFDSLHEEPTPPPLCAFPAEKDETDGELALDRAIALGAKDIRIYGGGGGREDHFLGNLHLLLKAARAGICAALYTNRTEIRICGEGEFCFPCKRGETVSVLPFGGDAHIIDSSGLKYPMKDLQLCYGSTRGISNVTQCDGHGSIRVGKGFVLLFFNGEVV